MVCVGIEDETKTGSINWPLGKVILNKKIKGINREINLDAGRQIYRPTGRKYNEDKRVC